MIKETDAMSLNEINRQIRKVELELSKLVAEKERRILAQVEIDCDMGRRVIQYEMKTGNKFRFGTMSYFVTNRNSYGECKIMKGKTVLVSRTRNPTAELTKLFGRDARGSFKIRAW